MPRVFLSHSSKDKNYVRKVANIIGLNHCIIDECEFEAGMRNIDEIFRSISNTDIFVYFISENSLESDWVKKELNFAYSKITNFSDKQIQIYPIIIDDDIEYDDYRIADFLRNGNDSYNIRHILNPIIAARKIKTQLVRLEMLLDRRYEERKNYFYGRDNEKQRLKEKIDDVLNEKGLKCIVVAGISGIGRKSFINAALKDARVLESYYFPIVISLERTDSIDNFIRSLLNQGLGSISLDELSKINSMEEKEDILAGQLLDLQRYKEFLVVDDSMCLVNMNGKLQYWFEKTVKKLNSRLSIAIVSEVQLDSAIYSKTQEFTYVGLSELSKSDTLGMLRTYSKLEGIPFEKEDRDYLSDCLTGYPPQVEYCVELAKQENIEYVKDNSYKVSNMPEQVSVRLIELAYENMDSVKINSLLALMSQFGNLPVTLLNRILKIDEGYRDAFYRLRALSMCYYIGSGKEYVKLNPFLQNFVERNKYEVQDQIGGIIRNNIKEFASKIGDEQYTDELDYAEVNFYVKELLKEDEIVPERFLYGTVFLQSIIALYNNRKYSKIRKIVNSMIKDNRLISYEKVVADRIMYYYCLALAREKSCDFEKEVIYFKNDEHYLTYNFLMGYHYRVSGDFTRAEQSYRNVLKRKANDMKTRRELVFIYVSSQEYERALDLARQNYKQNKNNIHYMQAYFDCLIYKKNRSDSDRDDLIEIVETVKAIYKGIKVNGMYYQILAKYEAFICDNKKLAINYINEGIEENKNGIVSYLLKESFDIYEYFNDIKGMEESIVKLKKELRAQEIDDMRFNSILLGREVMLDAHKGKDMFGIQIKIDQNEHITQSGKERIKNNIEKIMRGQKILYEI